MKVAIILLVVAAVLIGTIILCRDGPDIGVPPNSGPHVRTDASDGQEYPEIRTSPSDARILISHEDAVTPHLHPIEIFQSETDYLPYILDNYERALSGETESQYLVWKLLTECLGTRDIFRRMNIDDIIAGLGNPSAAKISSMRRFWTQCNSLSQHGYDAFLNWRELLDLAAENGQPNALMELGFRHIRSGDSELAEQYVYAALEQGDPFAISQIASLDRFGLISDIESVSWMMTACSLGIDCGSESVMMTRYCEFLPECGRSDSLNDFLLKGLGQYAFDQARLVHEKRMETIGNDGFESLRIEWLRE